ncbi:MAG: hypothetical protein GX825_03060 [Syntrophomonadaceae bacterium]|nr:hypothetical protein [Syntrophomonadaceae bacterium]
MRGEEKGETGETKTQINADYYDGRRWGREYVGLNAISTLSIKQNEGM